MWYYIVYCVLYCSFAQVAAQLALHSLTLSLQIILRPRQLVVKPSLSPPLPTNRTLHQCRVATASVYPVWGGAIGWVFPTVSLINPKVIISTRCRGVFPHTTSPRHAPFRRGSIVNHTNPFDGTKCLSTRQFIIKRAMIVKATISPQKVFIARLR